jgi:hypothetical protein
MRNNTLLRITSKAASYRHKNFPKNTVLGKIALFRNIVVFKRLMR